MAGTSHTYMAGRLGVYFLLFIIAVILLGLSSYRIHFTETATGERHFYNPIVVELIVCAILCIIWIPFIVFFVAGEPDQYRDHMGKKRLSRRLGFEGLVLFILWVLWLVGAAYTTNRILPGRNYCRSISGKQCSTLTAIVAFAWIGFGLLTILAILCLLHLQSAQTIDTSNAAAAKERALAEPNTQQGTTEPPVRMPTPNPAPAPSSYPAPATAV
ncbi:hypothetical protein BDZ89DRAFT_1109293 [Hymenopellis radicata]|nr:hypothetical protein BDZ89DRAFT_1109293 [Hymenopellis radicata]